MVRARLSIERIVLKIREAGFSVVAQKDMQLTKDLVEEMFDMSKTKDYFTELVQSLTRFAINHRAYHGAHCCSMFACISFYSVHLHEITAMYHGAHCGSMFACISCYSVHLREITAM